MSETTILLPDDFHHHLRDGDFLPSVLRHASKQFYRVIAMPNIKPPVQTLADAEAYRARIFAALPEGSSLQVLMTLYLTDKTTSEDILTAKQSGIVHAVKLYPQGATTNSEFGITSISALYPVLQTMSDCGMPLLVHGEVTDQSVDIFDRERVFIEQILAPLVARFDQLLVVMEHITTKDAVDFVSSASPCVAATITAHHLLYNRSDIFKGGVCPHLYCLPILKRETHRQALLAAATSGSPKFFLGTDSAPHSIEAKQAACGCAGCFTAHAAIELYAEAFASVGCLERLNDFASKFGAAFYGLPQGEGEGKGGAGARPRLLLKAEPWTVPEEYEFGALRLRPLRAGETVAFSAQRL